MVPQLKYTDRRLWEISPYLAQYLAVKQGQTIWLHVGAKRLKVIVALHDDHTSMKINKQWANDLHLTPGKWGVRRVQNGVRLGPIIGIVCREISIKPPSESFWFSYVNSIDGGLGVLLNQDAFDFEHRCVLGSTLSEDKLHWVKGEVPWPDVLYVRDYPLRPELKFILEKEFPFSHFNSQPLFNKWFVFQSLAKRQDIKSNLPATAPLDNNPKSLDRWVEEYSTVYLKPILGHEDFGFMKITRDNGNFLVTCKQDQQYVQVTVPVTVSIREQFTALMGKKAYIMQQSITNHPGREGTCHLRVLLQKKEDGLWHVSGLWGRSEPVENMVDSPLTRAELTSAAAILQTRKKAKANLMKEIRELCLFTALVLEQDFGVLGEISLDLCIDAEDHMWIIDINSMPDKSVYSTCRAKRIFTAPMLYASYLSGFSEVIYPLAQN